jgi:hypothetical protein
MKKHSVGPRDFATMYYASMRVSEKTYIKKGRSKSLDNAVRAAFKQVIEGQSSCAQVYSPQDRMVAQVYRDKKYVIAIYFKG